MHTSDYLKVIYCIEENEMKKIIRGMYNSMIMYLQSYTDWSEVDILFLPYIFWNNLLSTRVLSVYYKKWNTCYHNNYTR